MCNSGYLSRIRHVYYQLVNVNKSSEELLIIKLISKAIVYVESALFHYGYINLAPRKWSIAVPMTISRTKLGLIHLQYNLTMYSQIYMN